MDIAIWSKRDCEHGSTEKSSACKVRIPYDVSLDNPARPHQMIHACTCPHLSYDRYTTKNTSAYVLEHFDMDSFVYRNTPSPKVIFGRGTLSSLAKEICSLSPPSGCKKPLLVSSPGRVSLAKEIRKKLGEDGIPKVKLVSTATVHNPSSIINDALPLAADRDCIVSLGGGSAVGLGKALALRTGLPHVVIPTTYSGSEMTPILGEKGADGKKVSVTDPKILPTVVIYDVDLTLDLPLEVSFPSGINALAHSSELHTSTSAAILCIYLIATLNYVFSRGFVCRTQQPSNVDSCLGIHQVSQRCPWYFGWESKLGTDSDRPLTRRFPCRIRRRLHWDSSAAQAGPCCGWDGRASARRDARSTVTS